MFHPKPIGQSSFTSAFLANNRAVPSNMVKSYPKILLLGDSLTEMSFEPGGYGAAIAADVSGKRAPGDQWGSPDFSVHLMVY